MAKIAYSSIKNNEDYIKFNNLYANITTASQYNGYLSKMNANNVNWSWFRYEIDGVDESDADAVGTAWFTTKNTIVNEINTYNAAIDAVKGQIDNINSLANEILKVRDAIKTIGTFVGDFDRAIASIFGLEGLVNDLNEGLAASSYGGDARFVIGLDENGYEEIVLELLNADGTVSVYRISDLTNGFMVFSGAAIDTRILLGIDATVEEQMNALATVDGVLERAQELGLFGATTEEETVDIWKTLITENPDKFPDVDISQVTDYTSLCKALGVTASATDLGYTPEAVGESVWISSGLVTVIGDIAGVYDEVDGEREYDFGKENKLDEVTRGTNITQPITIEDKDDFAAVQEKMKDGMSLEDAIKAVNEEKHSNDLTSYQLTDPETGEPMVDSDGNPVYNTDVKTTELGEQFKEDIAAQKLVDSAKADMTGENGEVLGADETELGGGDGGFSSSSSSSSSSGSSGSSGSSYSYTSNVIGGGSSGSTVSTLSDTNLNGTSTGTDTSTGSGLSTTNRSSIEDIIQSSNSSSTILDESVSRSLSEELDFGTTNYDELALEEYDSLGDQVKTASLLAAVTQATDLFNNNPTELYSQLQAMGYNDSQINDIMADADLTKQAFADNQRREDIAKIAKDKAAADGNNDYESEYSNKNKSIKEIQEENELISSNQNVADAKAELDAAVSGYKNAVSEANTAVEEAKSLKSELDSLAAEYGNDTDSWTDDQYNKYTELANKYNKAVDSANTKIENVNSAKEVCIKAQDKYDSVRQSAKNSLSTSSSSSSTSASSNSSSNESVGVSNSDLIDLLNGNDSSSTTYSAPTTTTTDVVNTNNVSSNEGSARFTATATTSDAIGSEIVEDSGLSLNVNVPTAQDVLESNGSLPTNINTVSAKDVLGNGTADTTEAVQLSSAVVDGTASKGISNEEIVAGLTASEDEKKKSKADILNTVEQASGIGLVGLGGVAVAKNFIDKKNTSDIIKEHQANNVPQYVQEIEQPSNSSITDVLQNAGVKSISAGTMENVGTISSAGVSAPTPSVGTPGLEQAMNAQSVENISFDANVKNDFSKSVIGSRVDLVTKAVNEAYERFTFDKELFKDDLRNINYSDEDIELLMNNEELAIVAILDGKVREELSRKAREEAVRNGILDYVSKYDSGRSVVDLANGTVFDFLKEVLNGVESGLDITTRTKLKRVFNDEGNKE